MTDPGQMSPEELKALEAEVDAEMAADEAARLAERDAFLQTLPRISDAESLLAMMRAHAPASIVTEHFYELGTVVAPVDKNTSEVVSSTPMAIIDDDPTCSARQLMNAAEQADKLGPVELWGSLPLMHAWGAFYLPDYLLRDMRIPHRPAFERGDT